MAVTSPTEIPMSRPAHDRFERVIAEHYESVKAREVLTTVRSKLAIDLAPRLRRAPTASRDAVESEDALAIEEERRLLCVAADPGPRTGLCSPRRSSDWAPPRLGALASSPRPGYDSGVIANGPGGGRAPATPNPLEL